MELLRLIGLFLMSASCLAEINERQVNRIIQLHNSYRRILSNGAYNVFVANMKKLEWSNELHEEAKRRLSCSNLTTVVTDPSLSVNVNIGVSIQKNIRRILRDWFNEINRFIMEYKTCIPMKDCKRFLTMVNAENNKIGCEILPCIQRGSRVYVMLCVYDGGQDLLNPFKTGPPCTKCTGNNAFCEKGLCVPCAGGNCDCRKNCTKPGIGIGVLDSSTCSCNCSSGLGPNCDEPCQNPEQYVDYDICQTVTVEDCSNEEFKHLLQEFCPEQCLCNKYT